MSMAAMANGLAKRFSSVDHPPKRASAFREIGYLMLLGGERNTKMPETIKIIDNFYPRHEFEAINRFSATAPYEQIKFQGLDYHGICRDENFNSVRVFKKHGIPIASVRQFFRIYAKGVKQNTFIHSDAGISQYGAVLGLGEKENYNGHLAFWQHRRTGWTEPDDSDSAGMDLIAANGLDEKYWERTRLIELIPNRCVIFGAALFHSRYPRDWAEDRPRKIQVFLFDSRNTI